jgi:hypothetical protein
MTTRRAPGEIRDAIIGFVSRNKPKEVSVVQIREHLAGELDGEVAASSVRSYMQQLVKTGSAVRVSRGLYRWTGK